MKWLDYLRRPRAKRQARRLVLQRGYVISKYHMEGDRRVIDELKQTDVFVVTPRARRRLLLHVFVRGVLLGLLGGRGRPHP